MWLGIGYTIPMVGDRNLKIPPPDGGFIELEPNSFLIELEGTGVTDKITLE
jgi:hypothetical protein